LSASRRPVTLAITMGDPRGIGPEVVVKALAGGRMPRGVRPLVVGSGAVLERAARDVGLSLPPGAVLDLDNFPPECLEPRRPDAAAGRASLDYIERAVEMTLAGTADAVVTAPIHKQAIAAAGSPHPGHTEMLAALCGGGHPVMLMVSGRLRVAMVTTHLALRDVPRAVDEARIVETARVVFDGLRRFFGIAEPRLAICGLNPHCSDGGRFGDEEARIIAPALSALADEGMAVAGPLPADTVFCRPVARRYDAILALYHDQGMMPVKLRGLGSVVNVTLGLRIIRTSVGHGTAYDIAGTRRADESSLLAAVRLAARMARRARAAKARGG